MKNLADSLFKVSATASSAASGSVLVSEPFLAETFFNHSVLSLIDYIPDEGATGVVLNNRTDLLLSDVIEDVDDARPIKVFCGGPLGQDRLFFIHTLGDTVIGGARCYAPGLYIGGDFASMTGYVNAGYPIDGYVRFFIGYSSWERGQLEREIREGSRAVGTTPEKTGKLLTGSGDSFWHRAVRDLGSDYRSWRLLPRNAELN